MFSMSVSFSVLNALHQSCPRRRFLPKQIITGRTRARVIPGGDLSTSGSAARTLPEDSKALLLTPRQAGRASQTAHDLHHVTDLIFLFT